MVTQPVNVDEESESEEPTRTIVVGKQLCTDYLVHKSSGECSSKSLSTSTSALPSDILSTIDSASTSMLSTDPCNTEVLV